MDYDAENWREDQRIDLAVVQSFGAFSPGGRFLAAADANTIEVRDAGGGGMVGTVEMLAVTSLAVSDDGTLLVAADDEGAINAWSLSPARSLWMARLALPPPAYAQVVYDVQFAAQGGLLVVSKPAGVNNTLVELWPVDAGMRERPQPRWQSIMLNSDYHAFSPSPDGARVVLATAEGYWVVKADGERLFIDGYYDSGEHAVLAFAPDGEYVAGIEPEGGWVYEVRTHSMREIDGFPALDEPTDVSWSPDGSAILITSEDGLAICARADDDFSYLGLLDDTPGFEAASFVTATTITAKRGDTLLMFSTKAR